LNIDALVSSVIVYDKEVSETNWPSARTMEKAGYGTHEICSIPVDDDRLELGPKKIIHNYRAVRGVWKKPDFA